MDIGLYPFVFSDDSGDQGHYFHHKGFDDKTYWKDMRKFNEEDLAVLAPYEDKLRKAFYSRYITGITREDWDVVYAVFKDTIGIPGMHYGCSHCELTVFGKVGRLYFKLKEEKDGTES